MKNVYESPFVTRYSSGEMLRLFSPETRYTTWRRLWTALADAERRLGLPVTAEQVEELRRNIENIDYACAAAREAEVRHDVMAHVYAYGKAAPKAAGIIHLGATSCYVTDNADLIIYRDALDLVRRELARAAGNLCCFAEAYRSLPALGYTHYQPAQLVTVGKRATLWLQDFVSDIAELDSVRSGMKFLGCRGTTGTEASFMELFDGDGERVDSMNAMLAAEFGFDGCFDVCGQTYPRKTDSRIAGVLSSIAQSASKFATDVRLLQHDGQLEEPFESRQIGSSAMPYKRNPMRCERICSTARLVITGAANMPLTASQQWLERTLDDSANRRVSMSELFLATDAVLRLVINVTAGLTVNEKVIEKSVRDYLPFIATENLIMEGVKRGGDRQRLHEVVRECSMRAVAGRRNGEDTDLLGELAASGEFPLSAAEMTELLDPARYTGRCAEQVTAYLKKVYPLTADASCPDADIRV